MTPTRHPTGPDGSREWNKYPLIVWSCVGFAALIVGGLLMVTNEDPASYGWFAYAPLSGDTFEPVLPFFALQEKIGLVIGVLGLAILVFCGGWAFGRGRSSDVN